MAKPFLSYDEQINLLKSKGLTIENEQYAKTLLARIGYFSLIGGYKYLFKNPTTKNYLDDVRFEDIVALYNLDEELRQLFLRYLLIVERDVKTKIAYSFCQLHGNKQSEYLDKNNYTYTKKSAKFVDGLIRTLTALSTQPTDYPFIEHQRRTYNNVPLWVLIKVITFGSLSIMYRNLPSNLQVEVAQAYPLNIPQLSSILSVMTKFRNACAHGDRLFSFKSIDAIADLPLHKKLQIPKFGTHYSYGRHDLFAVFISLRYLLPSQDFHKLKSSFSRIVDSFCKQCSALSKTTLLDEMGFPANWTSVSKYRPI